MPQPRVANWLSDMDIDEVSLVDRPANALARVAIAKRAPEEGTMDYFDANGQPVEDLDGLEVGTVIYDGDGNAFAVSEQEAELSNELDPEYADDAERELETVGKSFSDQVREDLSKALTDMQRDDVIAKAADEIAKANARADEAAQIAKAEQDLRLEREYTEVAKGYNLSGVTADELGPVLMRAAEVLPYADCAVIHKALTAGGAAFTELGYTGGAVQPSVVDMFGAQYDEAVSKGADAPSREAAISKAFEESPEAYDQYLADRAAGLA